MHGKRKLPNGRALIVGGWLLLGACQQSVSVNGHNLKDTLASAPAGSGVPVVLTGGLSSTRTYFQTRGVLTLAIANSQIEPTASLELIDDSTGATLLSTTPASIDGSGADLRLAVYPLDPALTGKIAYGDNNLRLLIDKDSSSPKTANGRSVMHDFPYFQLGAASFADGTQRSAGFQGSVEWLAGPFLSNGTNQISLGSIGLPNY